MTSTVLNIADYQPQLDEKAARIQDLLSDFETPELEVFASPAEHYRMRAEFRVWHETLHAYGNALQERQTPPIQAFQNR